MHQPRNVAIFIFDDVEVLDFCGPFEVFSVARPQRNGAIPFSVYTVAETARPILTTGHLSVNPRYTIQDCPPPDILLIPGGDGTRREMQNAVVLDWIKAAAPRVELLLSVCTGALILARTGLLDGLSTTTYHAAFEELRAAVPNTILCPDRRFVDNGRIILSGGISAGIDMAFHVVARLLGKETALATAAYMEYDWNGAALVEAPRATDESI